LFLKSKKQCNTLSLAATIAILFAPVAHAAPRQTAKSYADKVSIIKVSDSEHSESQYFRVKLDFSAAPNSREEHYGVGKAYGEKIKAVEPNYERHLDGYFGWLNARVKGSYPAFMERVAAIRHQVPELYSAEIDGIAAGLGGVKVNIPGDGKVSRDELYALNLLADIARITQCSAFSANSERTDTAQTILGRNLDWWDGDIPKGKSLSFLHAAVTVKNGSEKNSAVMVGFLGYQAWCTGIGSNGVFAAILDSPTGAFYPILPIGRRSYSMDLRQLMETSSNKEKVAAGIMGSSQKNVYLFNHLIALADEKEGCIVEDNYSGYRKGIPTRFKPAVRKWDSPMHDDNDRPIRKPNKVPQLKWPSNHTIGTVNSFLMLGHQDNQNYPIGPIRYEPKKVATFREQGGNSKNVNRLNFMIEKVIAQEKSGQKYSAKTVQEIITAHRCSVPSTMESGDLFNNETIQTFVVSLDKDAAKSKMQVFFKPAKEGMPETPIFQDVQLDW